MSLSDKLNAPIGRGAVNKAPSEFTPRIEVSDNSALIVTKPSTSLGPKADSYSADFDRIIRDNGLDPDAWTVVTFRRATWQVFDGTWLESFRCTLAPRGGADSLSPYPDLDDLHRAASRARRAVLRPVTDERVLVVSLADVQAGKVDLRGGTEELLERLEVVRAALKAHIKKVKPSEIILLDAGDAIENFESVSSQDRTNDLQLTEQIRVWRRVLWSFVETAAASAAKVTVAGVGSNHCRVRRGKGSMGTPSDDFGVEVIAQVADIAAAYPEKYGHVSFYTPDRHDESLTLPLPAGKVLGLVHGHQIKNPNGMAAWWAGQALGRTPVGSADYLVTGHFHHLRIEPTGNGRWWFQSPTIDSGSSWYRNATGVESDPGVLTFVVEGDGSWSNLAIL